MSEICEYCGKEHDGEYGSGRFCSSKCARGFSTKVKRVEINAKISKKLLGSGNGDVTKKCLTCGNDFTMNFKHRYREFCSPMCSNNHPSVKLKLKERQHLLMAGNAPMGKKERERLKMENRRLKREAYDLKNNIK